jgi:hypothetical protein
MKDEFTKSVLVREPVTQSGLLTNPFISRLELARCQIPIHKIARLQYFNALIP